jgi:hypothetical protein
MMMNMNKLSLHHYCLSSLFFKTNKPNPTPPPQKKRRPGKPTQLMCILGPFWPCLLGVTYPLVIGVSLFASTFLFSTCPMWVIVIWCLCTGTLIIALGMTGCTNPGIVRRYPDEPPSNTVRDNDDVYVIMNLLWLWTILSFVNIYG